MHIQSTWKVKSLFHLYNTAIDSLPCQICFWLASLDIPMEVRWWLIERIDDAFQGPPRITHSPHTHTDKTNLSSSLIHPNNPKTFLSVPANTRPYKKGTRTQLNSCVCGKVWNGARISARALHLVVPGFSCDFCCCNDQVNDFAVFGPFSHFRLFLALHGNSDDELHK